MNKAIASTLLITLGLSGCANMASSQSGQSYSRNQVQTVQTVTQGVVTDVRQVKIEGTSSGVGTLAGAIIGGVLGSSLGGGKGKIITTTAGAVAGGVGGNMAENAMTAKTGLEITIQTDKGNQITIVQEADEVFTKGERVKVLVAGGVARVAH